MESVHLAFRGKKSVSLEILRSKLSSFSDRFRTVQYMKCISDQNVKTNVFHYLKIKISDSQCYGDRGITKLYGFEIFTEVSCSIQRLFFFFYAWPTNSHYTHFNDCGITEFYVFSRFLCNELLLQRVPFYLLLFSCARIAPTSVFVTTELTFSCTIEIPVPQECCIQCFFFL